MVRRSRTKWAGAAIIAFAMASPAAGQSVQDILGRYTGANADGFLQPLADVLGASLGSGWARSADIQPGLHIKVSAVLAGAPISDDNRTFMGTTEDFTSPETTTEVPTIFGSTETVAVSGPGGTVYRFPGGIDASLMGTIVPQLTVGSYAGTEAMIRWAAADIDDEFGKLSLIGLGARHDLDQYLINSPVDLALGVYWQSLKLGDVLKVNTFSAMAHASRAMSFVTVFGALGYETSSTDITYTQEGEDEDIDISLDGGNSIRATAGLSLDLFVAELFADYTLASQSTFTLGLGLGR